MTNAESIAGANKRTLVSKSGANRLAVAIEVPLTDYFSSVLSPPRGRTQEGEALAVYFAMNTASELGDTRSWRKRF